jgi:hypothetical protein
MGRGVFQFKSFWDTAHVQMMYPLPNPRISHTDARLFMNMVQIRLKSQDSRIPGFQLDLKIVYEFQLCRRLVAAGAGGCGVSQDLIC